jgi:tartrate-resistant acid phosphatase type 5
MAHLSMFLVTILLVACNSARPLEEVNTPTPPIISTPSPLLQPSPTEIPTAIPSPTNVATPVPSSTPTQILSTTITTTVPVRFAVIGDYGSGSQNEADVADLVLSWAPDLIITTGDNNYPSGSAATIDENIGQFYHAYISPYLGTYGDGAEENRFFPSLGNHDWSSLKAQPYLDYFTLPGNERYYDFVWGPLHFFALDSDSREPDGVGSSSIQASWLVNQLAASIAPWNIVYMHHPPYSSGEHGDIEWMQWPFQAWGATVVISGHDHTYERIELNGFPYFINGLGGKSRYNFPSPVPGSQVRYNQDYGAMLVEATEDRLNFQFINRQGEIIDQYQLNTTSSYSHELFLPLLQQDQTIDLQDLSDLTLR